MRRREFIVTLGDEAERHTPLLRLKKERTVPRIVPS